MIETMILSLLFGAIGGAMMYHLLTLCSVNKIISLKKSKYKLWIIKHENSYLITLYKPNGERLTTEIKNDSIEAINYANI